jgi:RNA polymerase-binding transcription factor DksA
MFTDGRQQRPVVFADGGPCRPSRAGAGWASTGCSDWARRPTVTQRMVTPMPVDPRHRQPGRPAVPAVADTPSPGLAAAEIGRDAVASAGHRRDAAVPEPSSPIEVLRTALEAQFQRSTEQLAVLTVRSQRPDRGGYEDDDTLAALIASARRAVADTAQALRRMAEGSYGICERCAADIPLQRLEILPHARFCVPCQRRQTG